MLLQLTQGVVAPCQRWVHGKCPSGKLFGSAAFIGLLQGKGITRGLWDRAWHNGRGQEDGQQMGVEGTKCGGERGEDGGTYRLRM